MESYTMNDYLVDDLLEKLSEMIIEMEEDEPRFHIALEFAQQLQEALQDAKR